MVDYDNVLINTIAIMRMSTSIQIIIKISF